MTRVTLIFLELLLFLTYFSDLQPFFCPLSSRYSRAWGPVNRWAEVVDIDVLRRLFENALAPRRPYSGKPMVFSARNKGLNLFLFLWRGVRGPG